MFKLSDIFMILLLIINFALTLKIIGGIVNDCCTLSEHELIKSKRKIKTLVIITVVNMCIMISFVVTYFLIRFNTSFNFIVNVNTVAREYYKEVDKDELFEIGSIGLVKAINTFDFSRECSFSTYAVPLIFGEIRRFLRDDGMIKVARESKRLSALLNKERERRLNTGEDVGIVSLAKAVGATPEDSAIALFATMPVQSFEDSIGESTDERNLESTLCDADEGIRNFDKMAIKFALEKLGDTEKKIIILRYFRDFSQTETAKILGLTQVKISREEKKILAKLKTMLE